MRTSSNISQETRLNPTAFSMEIGNENVITDKAQRAIFARDIMEWNAPLPEIILRPANTQEVSACAVIASRQGAFIAPRGGGLSYTRGYVPSSEKTVVLDLTRLNQILEFNAEDRFVTVGAGCTWKQLTDTLKSNNLRTTMTGPISGIYSTIGGAASQNIPGSMEGIIGLEIVLADGQIVQTGSGAVTRANSRFFRNYGPDLTGLFLGDSGAYAIKTRVTMQLQQIPEGVSFASYAFDSLTNMARAMADIARLGVASKTLGMDPLKNKMSKDVSLGEGLDTLQKIAFDSGSLSKGLKDAVRVATAGREMLVHVPWSLHLTVEGFDQSAADRAMKSAATSCRTHGGKSIEPTVPLALRAKPYSIRGFLGMDGERWVPVHGVFPLSRTDEIVNAVETFFSDRRIRLDRNRISHSFISSTNGPFWLLEPMFYWHDEITDFHLNYLEPKKRKKFAGRKANELARAEVVELRSELRDLFFELGSVTAQIGKYYNFAEAIEPESYKILSEIKQILDPENRLNPGNLGWDRLKT